MSSTHTIDYEFPVNQKYRTLLKLEHYLLNLRTCAIQQRAQDLSNSLAILLNMLDFTNRTQIHHELLEELIHHHQNLSSIANTPAIDKLALDNILQNLSHHIAALHQFNPLALSLLQSELIKSYQKRNDILCGTLACDVPLLHYWSHQPTDLKQALLDQWFEEIAPLENALTLLLHLVRQSAYPKSVTTNDLKYFVHIPKQSNCAIIRIAYDADYAVYPNFSGNHQRIYINFHPIEDNSLACQQTFSFDLTLCALS